MYRIHPRFKCPSFSNTSWSTARFPDGSLLALHPSPFSNSPATIRFCSLYGVRVSVPLSRRHDERWKISEMKLLSALSNWNRHPALRRYGNNFLSTKWDSVASRKRREWTEWIEHISRNCTQDPTKKWNRSLVVVGQGWRLKDNNTDPHRSPDAFLF